MNAAVLLPMAGLFLCAMALLLLCVGSSMEHWLLALIGLYLGCALILLRTCSSKASLALTFCGFGCCALLGIGHVSFRPENLRLRLPLTRLFFRVLLCAALGVPAFSASLRLQLWISVNRSTLFITLWMMLCAFINLILEEELLFRCVCQQCICLAFTLSYLFMDHSLLVFACFMVINLLLAFGSVILMQQAEDPQ